MINRKWLKQNARLRMKKSYGRLLLILLLMMLFMNEYSEIKVFWLSDVNFFSAQILARIQEDVRNANDGVLAALGNNILNAGGLLFGVVNFIDQMVFRDHLDAIAIQIIAFLVYIVVMLFVTNIVKVGERRCYLEVQTYDRPCPERLLFIYRLRRTRRTAKTMMFYEVKLLLWFLTLGGYLVKRYEYFYVPYLIAENPNLDTKTVFRLSREMTQGRKWEMFLLDVSFWYWHILGILSLGLANLFWTQPYINLTRAQLYMSRRAEMLAENEDYVKYYNDTYLASAEGVSSERYPMNRFTIPEVQRRQWLRVNAKRSYCLSTYILLFFTASIGGWLWEVMIGLVRHGVLINRGFLHGPWLPIYGTGAVAMLFLLKRFSGRPWLVFFLGMLVSGVLEYSTATVLWKTMHLKWWDYSDYLVNLHGRICLEGLLVFAIGGLAVVYGLAPVLDNLYQKIDKRLKCGLCLFLCAGLIADTAVAIFIEPNTGAGVTEENHSTQWEEENDGVGKSEASEIAGGVCTVCTGIFSEGI